MDKLSKRLEALAQEQQDEFHRHKDDGDPRNLMRYHQGMRNGLQLAAKMALCEEAEQSRVDREEG